MITLYKFTTFHGLPSISPFCMKVETYLRMARLPFTVKQLKDPSKAPKKLLPYIEDSGKVIADSSLIIEYLQNKYNDPLSERNLSWAQRAQSLTTRCLIEDQLYWAALYSRWVDPTGWDCLKEKLGTVMPWWQRMLLLNRIRKRQATRVYHQGMGRYTTEEVYRFGKNDLDALSAMLSDQTYFLGKKPSSLDASAYGFLANILYFPALTKLQEYLQSLPNLVNYCQRLKADYYS